MTLTRKLSRSNSYVGTEEYLAPETILDEGVSYATDLWSLGIILYEFFHKRTPFRGENIDETID